MATCQIVGGGDSHVMPGWGCCQCRVYNGDQWQFCKNCEHVRCNPDVPSVKVQMDVNLLAKLVSWSPHKAEEGDYAKLIDEEDEDGLVGIYRKDGTMTMAMPRDVWDALQREKPKKSV